MGANIQRGSRADGWAALIFIAATAGLAAACGGAAHPVAPVIAVAPPRLPQPPPPPPLPPVPPPPVLEPAPPPVPQTCAMPALAHDDAFAAAAPAPPAADPRAIAYAGTLHAIAVGGDLATPTIELRASHDAGASWDAPVRIDAPADCAGLTNCPASPLLIAAEPRVFVLYAGDDIGLRVRASRDRGATFGPSTVALAGTLAGAAISGDGRLHVAAIRGGPLGVYGAATHRLEYAVSAVSGPPFSRASIVSGGDDELPLVAGPPVVAIDSARRLLYVAYVRGGRTLAWEVVVAVSKDRGATWRRTVVSAPSPCAIRVAPAAAIDATTGALHLIWLDSRNGGAAIHASCASGAVKCAERGTLGEAPLALDPALPPTPTSLAIDARRRGIRATWTQPMPTGAQLVTATGRMR